MMNIAEGNGKKHGIRAVYLSSFCLRIFFFFKKFLSLPQHPLCLDSKDCLSSSVGNKVISNLPRLGFHLLLDGGLFRRRTLDSAQESVRKKVKNMSMEFL